MRPIGRTSPSFVDLITEKISAYLVAASEYRRCRHEPRGRVAGGAGEAKRTSNEKLLAGFVDYLGRVAAQPSIDRHKTLRDAAAGTSDRPRLAESAARLAPRAHGAAPLAEAKRGAVARPRCDARTSALLDPLSGR